MRDPDRAGSGSRPPRATGTIRPRSARLVSAGCALLLLGSGLMASQASAAGLIVSKKCYVNANTLKRPVVTIAGGGFTPGDDIELEGTQFFATATVSPTGSFVASGPGPILDTSGPASKSFTVTATDDTAGAVVATTTIKVANLAVATTPANVKNIRKDKVTFTFSGFTPGKRIYGYYARNKILAKTNFGKSKGVCGLQRTRKLLYPGGRPAHDAYKVTFESRSRYSKKATPRVSGTLNIFKF